MKTDYFETKNTKQDQLINVFGCFKCKKLAGDLRTDYITETNQGYEICPICRADLDYFWLNLTWMCFQESRPVTEDMIKKNIELSMRGSPPLTLDPE